MFGVIGANNIFQYKETPPLNMIIILLGGSMFLRNPLYRISWFITLILLLYLSYYILSLASIRIRILTFLCLSILFTFVLGKQLYFGAFFIGILWGYYKENKIDKKQANKFNLNYASYKLFSIQKYCYSFFLLHGGVLLFYLNIVEIKPIPLFILSFASCIILSIPLFHTTELINSKLNIMIKDITKL
jgi:hypothetical protein